jgi:hypothetical protein
LAFDWKREIMSTDETRAVMAHLGSLPPRGVDHVDPGALARLADLDRRYPVGKAPNPDRDVRLTAEGRAVEVIDAAAYLALREVCEESPSEVAGDIRRG